MDQFQYLSLAASPRSSNNNTNSSFGDTNNNGDMPPLSPVLKHESDPFAFEWSVKREPNVGNGAGDMPDADCPPPLSNLFTAFALPPLPSAPLSSRSFDITSVDGNDAWSQLASVGARPSAVTIPSVRFAANATSVPRFTFNMPSGDTSAPSSPKSTGTGMNVFSSLSSASSAASSRAASPISTASSEDDEAWSPSSSTSANSPSSMSIRSSLSAFRSRTNSVSSSTADESIDCDSSPDADYVNDGSLSPLADAATTARSVPIAIPRSSSMVLKSVLKTSGSCENAPITLSTSAPKLSRRKSGGDDVKRVRRPLVGPTGLPVTPMCSPSASDAIATATSTKASLQEVGKWTVHFVPDCENPRPPKAKATPLNIVLSPPSSSSTTSMVPVRIRLRPQAPRSFRNVVKTARTYTTMHGVAPPADASDKDPNHFLYFSITAIDSSTKLAGPQAAHVAGRSGGPSGDRTRRQAKFKHADDKKEYQGHVQLDLSQPGDGARLEIRLFTAASLPSNSSLPRFHVVTSQCDHKFAHMYVTDHMNHVGRV
jgi:hypothetical protein